MRQTDVRTCTLHGRQLIPRYRSIVRLKTVQKRANSEARGPIYKISYDLVHDYRKFIVRSTYVSDLTCAEISLREYRKLNYDTIFDDIMICT